MLSHKEATLFLFLEGFASVAIQFLLLRQLTPFVGTSIIIVSLVISFFLASLAIGYRQGGKVVDGHTQRLSSNLFKAASLLGIFGSYLFVASLYRFFNHVDPIIVLSLYLLFIMVPIVYLVAQTIPILVNSMSADSAGEKAGDALLFSTVGNVFGGILTTVVIMYYFGVSYALVFTVFILFLLSVTVAPNKKRTIIGLVFVFPLVLLINIGFNTYRFVGETPYANYEVREDENNTYFISNKSFSSKLNKQTAKGYDYIEKIKGIIESYSVYFKEPKALVLGAGGFSLTAERKLNVDVYYVDIDSQILPIAQKYFLKKNLDEGFTGEDARVFLRDKEGLYDFIIVDAYSNKLSIPGNLTTVEFYQEVSKKLKPNGLMIANIIADPFLSDHFSKRMDNTVRAPFLSCFTDVVQSGGGVGNILYVCSNHKKNLEVHTDTIYSDNDNRATVDFFRDRVN